MRLRLWLLVFTSSRSVDDGGDQRMLPEELDELLSASTVCRPHSMAGWQKQETIARLPM